MPSGWERTRQMAAVFAKMKAAAPDGQAFLDEFIESPSAGTRLGAIAILQMFPREQYVDWLATRLDNPELEAPFVGYQAAVALAEAVRALPRDSCLNLRASFEKAKALASKLPKDSDRLTVLESAEAELARKCSDASCTSDEPYCLLMMESWSALVNVRLHSILCDRILSACYDPRAPLTFGHPRAMGVAEDSLDRSIVRARRRLIPFLLFMYVVSFLDRANIGFAKLALQQSTGISEAAYALGAGLFFVSYALLEVPSNLILHRVGAKAWMSRIMVTWGLASAATMFATGPISFCLLRLLLGAAEAGFFPGVILYLTYWFPNNKRGQILGLFYLGAPLAFILGGPLSGSLLQLHGVGRLQGWQWMFLVEGLMSVVGGILTYWYLDDKPENARWMPAPEKTALMQQLRQRRAGASSSWTFSVAYGAR